MLGTTMWFALVIGLLATVVVETAASLGRAALHAAADHALEPALNDALADFQNAVQRSRATGIAPGPLARTYASGPDVGEGGYRFTLTYEAVPTTIAAPSCGPPEGAAAPAGPDAVAWLQCSPIVRESRLSLHVTARVLDAAGADVLARREQYVTLRLFAEPPFSAVVGRADGSAGDPAGHATASLARHEGDATGDGALIHVRYECRDGAGRCANAAPPDPDGALRAGAAWTNGNVITE